LSYFTPGPQVGGEPLQVLFLQSRHGLTYARATSTVIMDKLIEFLGNAILISVGVWAIIRVGVISNNGNSFILSLIGLAVLLMWPIVHIILLYKGRYPFSRILRSLPFIPQGNNTVRLIIISERMAAAFCRRHMRFLVASGMASILSIAGMVFEYFLMVTFLGMKLNGLQAFAGFTAMQISFLFPLPAGLGAFEASQVFVLGVFGQPATMAISLTLLIRGRDLLNGGLGLLLAGRGINK
jgi:glycosyltransferase 2 family protein